MYHLLCCIVHRLAYNRDEKADLLLIEHIRPLKERDEFLDRIKHFGFFDSVRYVPVHSFKLSKGIALDENSSEEDIKTVIGNISRVFEEWLKDDLRKYREIYAASDISTIGVYMNSHGIPYNYFEDASGMLSQQERYLSITKNNNKTDFIINQYLGCTGRSKYVKTKLCDLKHQCEGFYDEKAVDFSIYEILKNVIPNKVDTILEFFGKTNGSVNINGKACLLLTQDLNTLKIKDLDLQELTLTTLIDYISPDSQIIIKPHPKDRWQNYRRIFPDSIVLERAEPAELLPFALSERVEVALTASSTSIHGVDRFAKKAYSFTTEIETNRDNIDYFYIITEIIKEFGILSGVTTQNINKTQISAFLDNAEIVQSGNEILIDGSEKCIEAENYSLAFFPFSNDKNGSFTITASYKPHKHSLMPQKNIKIAVFCNDKKYFEKLEKLHFVRSLKYTKADIEVTSEKKNMEDNNEKENCSICANEA